MSKTLYVGNLPFSMTDNELFDIFEPYGVVEHVRIIMDRETGRSKGFGFVEMASDEEADQARAKVTGQEVQGRALRVDEAVKNTARSGATAKEQGPRDDRRDHRSRDNFGNRDKESW